MYIIYTLAYSRNYSYNNANNCLQPHTRPA